MTSFDDLLRTSMESYRQAMIDHMSKPIFFDKLQPETRTPEEIEARRAEIEALVAADAVELEAFMVEFRELMNRHPRVRFYDSGYETEGVHVLLGRAQSERFDDGRPTDD